jgi:hypothetical protein
MKRLLLVSGLAAIALTSCGSSPESRAVSACSKAIAEKLADKTFELDKADMQEKIQKPAEGDMSITSTVVFDKGLPSESKQTFECRVRFDNPDAEPSVTFLQFNW